MKEILYCELRKGGHVFTKVFVFGTIFFHGIIASEIQIHVGNADGFRPHMHKYLVKLFMSLTGPNSRLRYERRTR